MPSTWGFQIGGYRFAEKWLKDRRGMDLSFDDVSHYRRVCAAVAETVKITSKIDELIDEHGGWPLTATH